MFDLNEVEGVRRVGTAGCCEARWTMVRVPGFMPHAAVLKCLKTGCLPIPQQCEEDKSQEGAAEP